MRLNQADRRRAGWCVLAAVVASVPMAWGQTNGTWVSPVDGDWNVASNWAGGSIPNGGGIATFGEVGLLSGVRNVNIPVGFTPTISELRLDSAAGYNIGSSTATGGLLTFAAGGGTINVVRSNVSSPNAFGVGHTISANLTGGSLTKSGAGAVTIQSVGNGYAGGTFINQGILGTGNGADDSTFGVPNAPIRISNGASFAVFFSGMTLSRPVVIEPTGGRLLNFQSLTMNGELQGSGRVLRLIGNVAMVLRANNPFTGVFENNTGVLTLGGSQGSLRNASGIIVNGQLNLDNSGTNGTNADRVGDAVPITMRGGELRLAGATAVSVSETLGQVTLTGGQNVFTVVPGTSAEATLALGQLVRSNRGTVYIRGTSLGSTPANNTSQFSTTSVLPLVGGGGAAGTTTISIVPWLAANPIATTTIAGSTLATQDPATGRIRGLAVSEYATALGGNAADNVIIGSTVPTLTVTVPSGGATVNAINITSALSGTTVTPGTVTGTGTLTVSSGVLLTSGGAVGRIEAPIAFPDGVEGVLHLQQTTVFANTISGNNGVTKTGNGQWAIIGDGNSSTYTGVTILQGGVTTFTGDLPSDGVTPSAFGISTSAIVLQPGFNSSSLRAQGNVTINRDLLVENYDTGTPLVGTPTAAGFGNAVGSETVVMNGNIVLNRNLRFEFDPTPLATINGVISGTGQLSDAFGSGQILNASNSFSGGINGTSGVYLAGNDFAFGSGPIIGLGSVNATGGLVALPQLGAVNGPKTIANPLILQRGLQFTGTEQITFTGEVNVNNQGLFFVTGTGVPVFTGNFINGGVDKQGSGRMILANPNVYPGDTLVRAGTLQVGNGGTSGVLGAGAVSLSTGATLAFNRSDSIVVPNNITGTTVATTGSVSLPATSGVVTLSGALSNINVNVAGGELRTVQPLVSTNGALSVTGGKAVLNTGAAAVNGIAARVTSATAITGGIIEIAGSGKTLVTGGLTIGSGGFVDLKANDLIVQNGNLAEIRSFVSQWWTDNSGLPGDTGLGSSEAFYTVDGAFATLAVYDNSGTGGSTTFTNFNGIAVTATDVLVKYTYRGDTDLNGVVDATDIANVLKGMQGLGTGWNFGDVNYDGVVNFFDLGLAQSALRGQGAPLGRAPGLGGGIDLGGGVIPEPSSLGLILAAIPFMSRRRR